jgi:hypothetical protein
MMVGHSGHCPPCPGFDPDGTAETEADYYGNCPICGAFIDTRDLGWRMFTVLRLK